MNRYLSRKFLLALYFALTATAALFTKYLTGGEFVEITLAILGVHHFANVADARWGAPQSPEGKP